MITFIIPTRNNLQYLKLAYDSIRKYYPREEIIILDDNSTDGTQDWLRETQGDIAQYTGDENIQIYLNEDKQVGHTVLYDIGVQMAKNKIFTIFHADMVCGPNYVENLLKHLSEGKVVAATRIEPPLHPEGKEKITKDFGIYAEDFRKEEFEDFCIKEQNLEGNKNVVTKGIFAPWAMHKKDFLSIGGHDKLFSPFPFEDSDLFQRLILAGYDICQSRDSFVYHFTCRGHRWIEKIKQDDTFYKLCSAKNAAHFIRKWGNWIENDTNCYPVINDKYDIGFVIENCNQNVINILEPIVSTIYSDCSIKEYINLIQPGTPFDITKRLKDISAPKTNNILVYFDANKLNNNNFIILRDLPKILRESGEIGEMEYDIFKFEIKSLETYQDKLVNNSNEYYTKQLLTIPITDPYYTNALFEIYKTVNDKK